MIESRNALYHDDTFCKWVLDNMCIGFDKIKEPNKTIIKNAYLQFVCQHGLSPEELNNDLIKNNLSIFSDDLVVEVSELNDFYIDANDIFNIDKYKTRTTLYNSLSKDSDLDKIKNLATEHPSILPSAYSVMINDIPIADVLDTGISYYPADIYYLGTNNKGKINYIYASLNQEKFASEASRQVEYVLNNTKIDNNNVMINGGMRKSIS